MTGYLLDTNVISEIRKGDRANSNLLAWFDAAREEELFLSVLVLGEIRSGIERIRQKDPAQTRSLERWLLTLETNYSERTLPVTSAIADQWGKLTALSPLSVVDGLMAATALVNDLTLVTRNILDVKRTGVKVYNPFLSSKD